MKFMTYRSSPKSLILILLTCNYFKSMYCVSNPKKELNIKNVSNKPIKCNKSIFRKLGVSLILKLIIAWGFFLVVVVVFVNITFRKTGIKIIISR